jgi:hypothetical protein
MYADAVIPEDAQISEIELSPRGGALFSLDIRRLHDQIAHYLYHDTFGLL